MDDLEVALQGDDHQTELSDNYSKDRLLGRKTILRLLISHTEESKGGQVFFRFHTEHLVESTVERWFLKIIFIGCAFLRAIIARPNFPAFMLMIASVR